MRFLSALTLCLLASGCASASGGLASQASTPRTVDMSGAGNVSLTYRSDASRARTFALNAPVETVWAALPDVFRMLEVEAGVVNPSGRVFGNPNLRVRGRLAGTRPSEFLDCGKNPIGVPLATNEPLQLSIITGLVPASDGVTRVEVRVQGMATAGASSAQASCDTTGKLEDRIQELLLARFTD